VRPYKPDARLGGIPRLNMSNFPAVIPQAPPPVPFRPPRYRPAATFTIMAVTMAVYVLMDLAGGSKNINVLLNFGAAYGPYFRHGQYWRAVMPMFLHIGWLHITLNMLALYALGPVLEQIYGAGRYVSLYVACGIVSAMVSMSMTSDVSAGASGAIFGVAGAILVTGYLHREAVPVRWRRAFGRGLLFLVLVILDLILGFVIPHIDYWGHLGGLGAGILLAVLIPPPAPRPHFESAEAPRPSQDWVWVPVVVVAVAMGATFQHYRVARQVDRLLAEGAQLETRHQNAEARGRFQQAAQRAPYDERPLEALGALDLDENRPADAVREYQQALRVIPGSPDALLGLSLAYRRQGDLGKARQALEAVFAQHPPTAQGHVALADLFAEQKFYAQAVAHYQQALRLDPALAVAHNNLAWLYATCDDPKFRRPQQALEHARRAVELSGGKEAAYVDTLAEALYVNGQYAQAVEVQTRALALDPASKDLQEDMAKYRQAAAQYPANAASQR
jgi:membrane associated rhomboid family serine protease/cytochrome c-type biogenesis protein CcmH/NrfG